MGVKKWRKERAKLITAWERAFGMMGWNLPFFPAVLKRCISVYSIRTGMNPIASWHCNGDNDIWRLFVPVSVQVNSMHTGLQGLCARKRVAIQSEQDGARSLRTGDSSRSDLDPEGKLLSYGPESEKAICRWIAQQWRCLPRCVVYQSDFDWQGVEKPSIAATDWIIYEVHVKGFTAHPSANTRCTGYYLSFIKKYPICKVSGSTLSNILPIQEIAPRFDFPSAALSEYWGYNTIGFFAPNWRYSSRRFPGCQIEESKHWFVSCIAPALR
jgi:pullulanase/glycogen debranching enzyme